jgi:tetratricopeptide (TPR) repeat protein
MLNVRIVLLTLFVLLRTLSAQEHDHPAPEKLGAVSFTVSCQPAVQQDFNRAAALLHSFTYKAAEEAFHGVEKRDPQCAMAHWGIAMSHFHQLWEPPIPNGSEASALEEITKGLSVDPATPRERAFLSAANLIFQDAATVPYRTRATKYEQAMGEIAAASKQDPEAQIFYALALLANASPSDKTHAKQKEAIALLEPLLKAYPQHPGVAHYLIHACDNAELADRGLDPARLYSTIAPSAPHALHMPSHIFTRLGLWEDSMASNIAAQNAAHQAGDIGEELHAMDYLVYAYLQAGRDDDAAQVIEQLKTMQNLSKGEFKVGYASTAMPIRYVVERQQWADAANVVPPASAPPHVIAIGVWAKGLGLARGGRAGDAQQSIDGLQNIEDQLHASGNDYWATQVRVMRREVLAWSAEAAHKDAEAVALMRQAADEEDSVEKLPVTPGPIVPAREQLGELLLKQGQRELAAQEFRTALASAPGRRGALRGAAEAAEHR